MPTTTFPRTTLYDTGGDAGIGGTSQPGVGQTNLPRPATARPGIGFTNPGDTNTGTGRGFAGEQISGRPTQNPNITATGGSQNVGQTFAPPPATPSDFPQNGTDPMTGWLATMGYTPADVMGMNQMPARYLYDMLQGRGMDPTGGLFYQMEPLADVMLPMYELMYGGGRSIDQGFEPNQIGNFMGGMWSNMMTPGGRGFDISELFANMLNPGGDNSILNNYLNVGTPEEQIENFRRYAMALGQLSGSGMYQNALSNYLSQRGYDYLQGFTGGNQPTDTFGQYVGNPMVGGR